MTRVVIALFCLGIATAQAESHYTQRMFRRAMAKDNMAVSGSLGLSPLYVLITVCDRHTGADRVVCAPANLFAGAIHTEYHLPYDTAGQRKEFEIAMSQPGRRFCFRRARAANAVEPEYNSATLAKVRQRLARKSGVQLRKEANEDGTEVTEIYRRIYRNRKGLWQSNKLKEALAHALLERGVLVGSDHGTGALYVDK
jgi:hypothetical protein